VERRDDGTAIQPTNQVSASVRVSDSLPANISFVLVLTGIELMFFSISAMFWI